jgi:hypothetical protein
MSLLDTIKAAREEAEEAGSLLTQTKKSDAGVKDTTTNEEAAQTGFSKRSAARAKPAREAAGSVRTTNAKDGSSMSKEERKAARDARRSEQDVAYDATQIVLDQQPGYKTARRISWGTMIVGMVFAIASFLIMQYMQRGGTASESLAALSIGLMVLAYVSIIGSFVYDYIKVRPMRKKAEETTSGMTQKRMKRMIAENEARKAEEKSSK